MTKTKYQPAPLPAISTSLLSDQARERFAAIEREKASIDAALNDHRARVAALTLSAATAAPAEFIKQVDSCRVSAIAIVRREVAMFAQYGDALSITLEEVGEQIAMCGNARAKEQVAAEKRLEEAGRGMDTMSGMVIGPQVAAAEFARLVNTDPEIVDLRAQEDSLSYVAREIQVAATSQVTLLANANARLDQTVSALVGAAL